MLQTHRSYRGMVTAPHHLAAQAGLRVLEDGGNAIEAIVAAAAAITVVYPHMNALGGDNFWLIHVPGQNVTGIDACGASARAADIDYYRERGFNSIPSRGPISALTVAGAVSGWQEALKLSSKSLRGTLSLARLLEDAIHFAEDGVAVTQTLASNAQAKLSELKHLRGFRENFQIAGTLVEEGERFKQPRIANTLRRLVSNGLDDFYHGKLALEIALDLEKMGSPLRLEDLQQHQARMVEPLTLRVSGHEVYNMPPPTQGLASLMLLGVYERLGVRQAETVEFVHSLVEATKRAFQARDRYVTDPNYMDVCPSDFLDPGHLDDLAADIDPNIALPWPEPALKGDTVWLGAVDRQGCAVSFIQSIYWEFGSGMVLDESGILWQNRGTSFSLDPKHHNCLKPGRRPFHTIQPALAKLSDGRIMPYGTMGGEGQPQTQAMIFSRHVLHGQGLQESLTAPRWLLGRTWGAETSNLRIENRFDPSLVSGLRALGHDVEEINAYNEIMGHAGALVYHPNGLIEGASDPRGDGTAAGF